MPVAGLVTLARSAPYRPLGDPRSGQVSALYISCCDHHVEQSVSHGHLDEIHSKREALAVSNKQHNVSMKTRGLGYTDIQGPGQRGSTVSLLSM